MCARGIVPAAAPRRRRARGYRIARYMVAVRRFAASETEGAAAAVLADGVAVLDNVGAHWQF